MNSYSQDAYILLNGKGKKAKYDKMVEQMHEADVVLLGELHNNPVCHWMQRRITEDIVQAGANPVLGAEMFESDNQLIIDEYLSGLIRMKDFEKEARLWSNYETDYAPLVQIAVDNDLKFVATNIPRRYAAMVNTTGLESLSKLSPEALSYIAPLPIAYDTANPSIKNMLEMDMGHGHGGGMENMTQAQSVKDATMAHFILQNRNEGQVFIHYQGDFHSANQGGIYWYLKNQSPDLNIIVLSSKESSDLEFNEEWEGSADYILVIDENMTKTY
ncbi:MAG TPA: iron-regulated protein [Flavobacteriales bacterium]|nr:iron-regulated protein [Flavobacteriales bacterium]